MKEEPSSEGLENPYIRVFHNYSMIAFGKRAIMTKTSLFTGSSKDFTFHWKLKRILQSLFIPATKL
jgi:hypothetical protein